MSSYLVYVSGAYGFAAVALVVLVAATWRDLARQHRLLGELEAKGLRRRRPAAPAAPVAPVAPVAPAAPVNQGKNGSNK